MRSGGARRRLVGRLVKVVVQDEEVGLAHRVRLREQVGHPVLDHAIPDAERARARGGGGRPARARAALGRGVRRRRAVARRPQADDAVGHVGKLAAHALHPLGEGVAVELAVDRHVAVRHFPRAVVLVAKGDVADVEAALLEVVQQVERHRRRVRHRLDERDRGVRLHQRDAVDGLARRDELVGRLEVRGAVLPLEFEKVGMLLPAGRRVGGADALARPHVLVGRRAARPAEELRPGRQLRALVRVAREPSAPVDGHVGAERVRRRIAQDRRANRHGRARRARNFGPGGAGLVGRRNRRIAGRRIERVGENQHREQAGASVGERRA